MSNIYAKVENGVIVEYPVMAFHIKNRGHSVSAYRKCIFDIKPELKPFQSLVETPVFHNNTVIVKYKISEASLQSLLDKANRQKSSNGKIEEVLLNRIITEIKNLTQSVLDSKAIALGYFSSISAISYETSNNAQSQEDAVKIKDYRDFLWDAVLPYINVFKDDISKLPVKVKDIDDLINSVEY